MRGGGSAVADTGGARVEGAMIDTAWRRGTASRSRSLFFARRRRLVRLQGASRGFWAKCSVQDVAPVTPIRHLRPANAGVCTSRQSAICGRRTPESVLRAEATAHREAEKWRSTKSRSPRRSTPSHPLDMASTAKPPDPMTCALTAILLPESRARTAAICRKHGFRSTLNYGPLGRGWVCVWSGAGNR